MKKVQIAHLLSMYLLSMSAMAQQDAFSFSPSTQLRENGALNSVVSGGVQMLPGWNPASHPDALKAGMKVWFFGDSDKCQDQLYGPPEKPASARMAEVSKITGIPQGDFFSYQWTPSGATSICDSSVQKRSGGGVVYIDPTDATGAVGMLTTSGMQKNGKRAFIGPYPYSGQNGVGTNRFITSTFVKFRQNWLAYDPLQPWQFGQTALVSSKQSIGKVTLEKGQTEPIQAKQQVILSVINRYCQQHKTGAYQPCQLQYLFNTGMFRFGVTDWSNVSWFQHANIFFDPVQGSIPILASPIFETGTTTTWRDPASSEDVPIFESDGSPTIHAQNTVGDFKLKISFDQLKSAAKAVAALYYKVPFNSVTDAQLGLLWGASWANEAEWLILSVDVGQEVYNPELDPRVEIGGGFSSIYVGPMN